MTVLHESWRAAATASRFPFEDHCNLTTTSGLVIPRSAIVDAAIHPPSPGPFRIGSIDVSVGRIQINFWNANRALVAVASWAIDESPEEIEVLTPEGNPAGVLVTNPVTLAGLRGWVSGTHIFPDGSADFVVSVCTPATASGLLGIRVQDEVFSGHVYIVGENGIVFSTEYVDDELVIRYDVVGDPLFYRSTCENAIHEEGGEGLKTKAYLQTLIFTTSDTPYPPTFGPSLTPDYVLGSQWNGSAILTLPYVYGQTRDQLSALRIDTLPNGIRFSLAGAEG